MTTYYYDMAVRDCGRPVVVQYSTVGGHIQIVSAYAPTTEEDVQLTDAERERITADIRFDYEEDCAQDY